MTRHLGGAALALIAAACPAAARDHDQKHVAFGAGVGTAGIEAQAAYAFTEWLSVRGGANFLDYQYDHTFDDIDYELSLDASSFGAFVDLRPFSNMLTLTGGAYIGDRKATLAGTPHDSVDIGGESFTPAEVGQLIGEISLGDFAPYAGLGLDNTFTTGGFLGFRLSLGVAFGEEPTVTLASKGGTLSATPELRAALAREQADIEDDASLLQYYPVASAGLYLKF